MSTRHRKDLRMKDFNKLAQFCRALRNVRNNGNSLITIMTTADGIETRFHLMYSVWSESDGVWHQDGLRLVAQSVIGVEVQAMRKIAKYMYVSEGELIRLLNSFSILGAERQHLFPYGYTYKHYFDGYRADDPSKQIRTHFGYILEQRRALGGFQKEERDNG